ncbi:MAG: hypothetical protein QOC56_2444 [Alphaproteobacteria bacterium]|jgi:CheY-like chemotaxis protein|nr:hypothetical protein [Alphaproteobacteria bacterium]
MSSELVSVRILAVLAAAQDRDLLRQGAGVVSVPVDLLEANNANAANGVLAAGDIDIVLIETALPLADRSAVLNAARAKQPPPFVILVAESREEACTHPVGAPGTADGIVVKPTTSERAEALMARCIRLRLPSRILIVDDSSTTRSIVRKILSASRFRLELAEAQEGIEALKQIASGRFDLVILDYNMPGLNGIETLSEIKRQYPRLGVLMMTSTPEQAVAEKARAAGAAAFLKKPFFPTDIDAVLYSLFGLRVAAQR